MKKEDYKIKVYDNGYDLCNTDDVVLYSQRMPYDKVYPGDNYQQRAEKHIEALIEAEQEQTTVVEQVAEIRRNQTTAITELTELIGSMMGGQ